MFFSNNPVRRTAVACAAFLFLGFTAGCESSPVSGGAQGDVRPKGSAVSDQNAEGYIKSGKTLDGVGADAAATQGATGSVAPETMALKRLKASQKRAVASGEAGTAGGAPAKNDGRAAFGAGEAALDVVAPETGAAEEPTVITAPPDTKVRVALLLPLTGGGKTVGRALLNAAQLAVFDFANQDFELLTFDTRGTAEGARDAAQLAVGDGAELIIGPLFAASVQAVAPMARQAGIPVISFTTDRTVLGDGVFTLGFLPRSEILRAVGFAQSQGVRRFAALVPDNSYGRRVLQGLRDAANRGGGTIVRQVFYDPNAGDFSNIVRSLANYDARRAALVSQRKTLEAKGDEVSQRALKRLSRLQTIGDLPFDALVLADGGKRLQAVAALLPFFDIDPGKIKMIGTGLWDEPGVGAEPALLGGWYAAPPPAARGGFVAQYEKVFGEGPPRLATLAYDAAALATVLGRGPEEGRYALEKLTNPNGFAGRDGIFRLTADGTVERGLAVLQVGSRAVNIVDPAPTTFQAVVN